MGQDLQVNDPVDDAKDQKGDDVDDRKYQKESPQSSIHSRNEEVCGIHIEL